MSKQDSEALVFGCFAVVILFIVGCALLFGGRGSKPTLNDRLDDLQRRVEALEKACGKTPAER